jgi:hypothetical protein
MQLTPSLWFCHYQKSSGSLNLFDLVSSLIRPPFGLASQVQSALNIRFLQSKQKNTFKSDWSFLHIL